MNWGHENDHNGLRSQIRKDVHHIRLQQGIALPCKNMQSHGSWTEMVVTVQTFIAVSKTDSKSAESYEVAGIARHGAKRLGGGWKP